jgi:nitrate reductase NapAB chaperone NapD
MTTSTPASTLTTNSSVIKIDLLQHLLDQSQNQKQKDTSSLRAHALVQWLLAHHFPSKIRKLSHHYNKASASKSASLSATSPHRGKVLVVLESHTDETLDESDWQKRTFQTIKKINVEDLGNMNAKELQQSIPMNDSDGRGMADLQNLEKKLSVKVVFDHVTGHVLLVGDEKKLGKKVFVIRNMISHYHWRLSGKDVAFDKATGKMTSTR